MLLNWFMFTHFMLSQCQSALLALQGLPSPHTWSRPEEQTLPDLAIHSVFPGFALVKVVIWKISVLVDLATPALTGGNDKCGGLAFFLHYVNDHELNLCCTRLCVSNCPPPSKNIFKKVMVVLFL